MHHWLPRVECEPPGLNGSCESNVPSHGETQLRCAFSRVSAEKRFLRSNQRLTQMAIRCERPWGEPLSLHFSLLMQRRDMLASCSYLCRKLMQLSPNSSGTTALASTVSGPSEESVSIALARDIHDPQGGPLPRKNGGGDKSWQDHRRNLQGGGSVRHHFRIDGSTLSCERSESGPE